MQTIIRSLFTFSLILWWMAGELVFGSLKSPEELSPAFVFQTVEGNIVAKGGLYWDERLSPLNEFHMKREYLVLQNPHSPNELIVLEFEPLRITIEQFQLGDRIQAELGSDGSIVSARLLK